MNDRAGAIDGLLNAAADGVADHMRHADMTFDTYCIRDRVVGA